MTQGTERDALARRRRASRITLRIVLSLIATAAAELLAGQVEFHPGDAVEVVDGPAALKVGKRTLTQVAHGTRLTALKVKGPWVKVSVTRDAKRYTGWIHARRLKAVPQPLTRETEAQSGIRCDRFEIIGSLTEDTLKLRLDTDLPDFTNLMVSVERSYFRKRNPNEAYVVLYFQSKSTVGEWRGPHTVSVPDSAFQRKLQQIIDDMAKIGDPFDVARIEDSITGSFTVPVNQGNPAFGKRNANLRGKMVSKEYGLTVVNGEKKFRKPVAVTAYLRSRSAHYGSLEVGRSYRLSKETPLMPEFEPRDPLGALSRMRTVPRGSSITVNEVRMKRRYPWYCVSALDPRGRMLGRGWINSMALMGQDITICESGRATPEHPAHTRSSRQPAAKAIPKDVTYTIIGEEILPRIKRSLTVRLSRKVSQDVLRCIAIRLRDSGRNRYPRTFIFYHLPGMQLGYGAWAITHFKPDLEVEILGLTAEQERALKQVPDDPARRVIGNWLDQMPLGGSRITIFCQDGRLFLQTKYKDGSGGKTEVIEKRSAGSRRFQDKEGSRVGEFYLLDKHGDLQLWDREGLISTARKIK